MRATELVFTLEIMSFVNSLSERDWDEHLCLIWSVWKGEHPLVRISHLVRLDEASPALVVMAHASSTMEVARWILSSSCRSSSA